MPPHRDGTAHEAQHRAKEQAEERDATIEEDGLDQVGVDERACDIRHEKREEPAEHALDDPLEEEWAADEVVRRADEAHDRDLSCARQDGHPDCGSDDDHGHARERQSEGDASDAGDVAQCAEQRRALEGDERVAQRTGHQGAFAAGPLDPSAESKTTAPRSISTVRNSWRLISSRLCVAIKTAVPPALISRSSWKMPRGARSSRLPVGSSAMRTNGSFTRARAMATRCCSPPDSSGGYAVPLPARPTSASTRATWDGMADGDAPVTSSAKATFCSAVRFSRRRKS